MRYFGGSSFFVSPSSYRAMQDLYYGFDPDDDDEDFDWDFDDEEGDDDDDW